MNSSLEEQIQMVNKLTNMRRYLNLLVVREKQIEVNGKNPYYTSMGRKSHSTMCWLGEGECSLIIGS